MKNTRRAWVFAGGDFARTHLPIHKIEDDDLIVCVDRGLEYCIEMELHPHMLIGDLDSAPQSLLDDKRLLGVKRYVYPSEKAASDLELALTILCEESIDEVVLLGVSGGRTDHMLFNWQLVRLRRWPFSLQLIDETMHAHVLYSEGEVEVDSHPESVLSLLPMERCTGVTTKGLQYPLQNAVIEVGSTLGLSNVVVSKHVHVKISSGTMLVMIERAKQGLQ
jgi:thiamine pyrophosphokinase